MALVLPGGGARSAYQVGVLKAVAGWCPPGTPLPFNLLFGTSAGGILAAVLVLQAELRRRVADAGIFLGGRAGAQRDGGCQGDSDLARGCDHGSGLRCLNWVPGRAADRG